MSEPSFAFRVAHTDGRARRGTMQTPHGTIETPAFMPVGTQGAVKAITHRDLEGLGADIILGNTYHLMLRPGDELIARLGGLHRFSGWSRPILTDSGGYQVFSLSPRRTIAEDGVQFRSHLDGALRSLTPESAVDIQSRLGSDVAMALDECVAHPCDASPAAEAMRRTLRWAARARARMQEIRCGAVNGVGRSNPGQAQFGIVQGSIYADLRAESAAETVRLGFDGYAIGGLSVGEPVEVMYDVVSRTEPLLPRSAPRYLMGTGTPADLVESVARGIDMFDCVLPTRNARNGQLFTSHGRLNIKNARYAEDQRPVDDACGCYTCRTFSRAYLRHLFIAGEIGACALNTLHNLSFYLDTMSRIRDAIVFGRFENFRLAFHQRLSRHTVE
jgi:queuine tRNA-ribosyltransferase